jgi:predicted O-linked N-acetylglucosamine transferase (SPINDLY family)
MSPVLPISQVLAQAAQAHRAGQFQLAETLYRQIIAQQPQHADALQMLGILCSQRGVHAEAEAFLSRAAALRPDDSVIHNNLGEVRRRRGALDEAAASYRQALALRPDFATAHYNLANVLKARYHLADACNHYREAVRLQPNYSSAHYNLGNTLLETGAFAEAITSYRHTLQLNPNHAEAHNNLGIALKESHQEDEAIASYHRASSLKPDFAEPLRNLGTLLEQQGKTAEAREALQHYLQRAPEDDMQRLHMDTLCPLIAASNEEIDEYRAHLTHALARYAAQPPRFDIATLHTSNAHPPFVLPYQGRDDRHIREQWAALFSGRIPSYERRISPTGKPHIGFVVTHGHEGVFLKCAGGLLNHLSGEQFQLTVICSQQGSQEILRRAIHNPAVSYLPISSRLDRAAEAIAQARIDVLYHWHVGSDTTNYFLPFFALAPIQCAFWGMLFTTGIPTVHYLTSCEGLETAAGDAHYSETLVRFKRLPTYYTRPPVPTTLRPREAFGFTQQQHLYLCPQNVRKVHPDFDPLLADILRRDPQGMLLLIEDRYLHLGHLLRQRLQQSMPDVFERVQFLPRMSVADYLTLTAHADVVLDTLHFGGGANTTYDAFAAGTPIVTLPTPYQRGRYAYAAYRQMGLDDGIATSAEDFVARALALGTDRAEQARVRARIQEASPALFEDMAAVREISDFFEQIIARARSVS